MAATMRPVMSRSSLLCLAAASALMLLTAGPVVRAQSDGSSVYAPARPGASARNPFEWLFGRPRPQAQGADAGRQRTYQPRKRTPTAARTAPQPPGAEFVGPPDPNAPKLDPAAGSQTADGAAQPAAPALPPVTVAVVGDSLSVFLAQGLQEIYADRPSVTVLKRNREASGLVRDDYHDWPKALRDLIATGGKIDAIVLQIGSNDRQQLRDETGVHDPRSDRWKEIYIRRIDALIEIAREKAVPLIWVGLPTMRVERYSADLLAFNELYRSRAQAAGSLYVDIWEAFTGDDGAYAANGPDVDGEIVRLRTSDGVHFTKAGARKLAFFADKELQKIVSGIQNKASMTPPPTPAAPGAEPQSAGRTTPTPAPAGSIAPQRSVDQMLGVPLPEAPLLTALAPRPAQGPVIALSAPPVAPGGVLLGAGRPAGQMPAGLFTQGASPAAKPGRADDFRVESE
mgnify:CR=1 FL=1